MREGGNLAAKSEGHTPAAAKFKQKWAVLAPDWSLSPKDSCRPGCIPKIQTHAKKHSWTQREKLNFVLISAIMSRQMFPKNPGCNRSLGERKEKKKSKKQATTTTIDERYLNHLLFNNVLTSLGALPIHKFKGRQNEPAIKNPIWAHRRNKI